MSVQSVGKMASFYSIVGCITSILGELSAKESREDKPAMVSYHMQKIKESTISIYKAINKEHDDKIKKSVPVISNRDGCIDIRLVDGEKELIKVTICAHTVEITTSGIVYKFTMPFLSKV